MSIYVNNGLSWYIVKESNKLYNGHKKNGGH
jgi:hypothetical protein